MIDIHVSLQIYERFFSHKLCQLNDRLNGLTDNMFRVFTNIHLQTKSINFLIICRESNPYIQTYKPSAQYT